MEKKTVSIALDRESVERLLGSRSLVTGAHCGDDGGDLDGRFLGALALGAHCGDDDEV